MGQYYKVVNTSKKEYMEPGDYKQFSKLMSHAYIGNVFTETVAAMLCGRWSGDNVAWVGDYADSELYFIGKDGRDEWDDDYDYEGDDPKDYRKIRPKGKRKAEYRYLVNRSLKEYVDLSQIGSPVRQGDAIHPLPILISEGNGMGGGDYNPTYEGEASLVGGWCFCSISLRKTKPRGYEKIDGIFREL